MHDRDIVHLGESSDSALHTVNINDWPSLDVKPDNILVNCHDVDQDVVVEQVQISDLENAAYLPKPRCIKGMLAGNDNWRSPEGHFKGELNKPSDLYSFGLVVSA
jgi:serine/threonine protein kinase